ncbi:hypothetical protein TNCT_140911 [Trichonephila clavata]|uniref:Peptidase A2 domain-containing protein n=1 Tax=Trichonephila clavata TaxID=2740835 RepID=A0A8X6KSI0_TRICU|nr:hypothetical protein TNCT_42231 [Trichonephila clavata]GFQ85025.1 hypothetical protein TNCT_342811 [Trichonephila clavata]GFR19340.1 hypothetical protein TNCT_140911 [Trichonephila clavata]
MTLKIHPDDSEALTPQLSKAVEISRLFISDKESATLFLVNSGVDISVIPPTLAEKRKSNKLGTHCSKWNRNKNLLSMICAGLSTGCL